MQALEYIKVKNSFAHKDTFIEFKPGRNYIIGNYGSGKSELIEMIGFALFGTAALRGKASTYPKLNVELKFNHFNHKFIVIRKTSDATLRMYDEDTDSFIDIATSTTGVNQKIISLLGYDYNIYLLSNYCQQGKLQYFSELTPAKRLQFIDKVSGIEDSKELLDWLNTTRKDLNNNIEMLKDIMTLPVIPKGVDINTDYDLMIKSLIVDTKQIIKLQQELKDIRSTRYLEVPPVPKVIDSNTKAYSIVTDEQLSEIDSKLIAYDKLYKEIESKERELRALLKCPTPLKGCNLTLEEAMKLLNQIMLNSLVDTEIECPSCSTTFSTESLKDVSHKLHKTSVKDISTYIAWLDPEIQENTKNLTREIRTLSKTYESLSDEVLLGQLQACSLSSKQATQLVYNARKACSEYESQVENRSIALQNNKDVDKEVSDIDEKISKLLLSQAKDTALRESYISKLAAKNLYTSQLELYNQAKDKYDNYVLELNIVIGLIKEIKTITETIKLETIPLINHHASKYLNMMTKGVMNNITITDNYDLIVDGHPINLRSGAQKDLSSLAFRLSLGQSIILGMLPLFIGDEIDASSPVDVANDITDALDTMSSSGYQIIMITHKDVTNLENCNIINLG